VRVPEALVPYVGTEVLEPGEAGRHHRD
jgi:hypothetical protein